MTYDPHNVKHPSGIPLAYQASTHDPDFGRDFAAADEADRELVSRSEENAADLAAQADANRRAEADEGQETAQLDGQTVKVIATGDYYEVALIRHGDGRLEFVDLDRLN